MALSPTHAALKEWAIVCRALEAGRQTLLIRKGGIEEIKSGFEVSHRAFWLFPTTLHQNPADLVARVREEFETLRAAAPAPDTICVQLFATVDDVAKVTDLERLRALEGRHILSWDCVASRFQYRNRPGVHVLTLRVYRRAEPFRLQSTARYEGCVSWVDLDQALDPMECVPVLGDGDHARQAAGIRQLLGV
jgi:hypothetical protein